MGPRPEECDGQDNDCNGVTDDGLGELHCGQGACERTVPACVSGAPTECVPGEPSTERCGDGVDNNCDGTVDEPAPGCCQTVADAGGSGLELEVCTLALAAQPTRVWMGCREDSNAPWPCRADDIDKPQHRVRVAYDLHMMRTEVTVDQYEACARAGAPGCSAADHCDGNGIPNYGRGGRPNEPIVCVSWDMARAFCAFVGGRLPSEAEWELAARAPMASAEDYAVFPWGDNTIDCGHAAYLDCPPIKPHDVGSHSPAGDSSYGVADLAGNVWEWTLDCWHPNYAGAPEDGSAWVVGCTDPGRVAKGGAYSADPRFLQASVRSFVGAAERASYLGFRCVLTDALRR